MLFNSIEFIFFFLPISLSVFFGIGKRNYHLVAISWLVLCSLFFYGWWNPAYLALILFSMLFNYAFGVMLGNTGKQAARKGLLIFGIAVNLGLLGYYKYAHFFVEQVNGIFESSFHFEQLVLPLAISFFTFQQVAYLVDAYRHETKEYNFLNYCLFVSFFPQLIAGPIVHHKEMLPQFTNNAIYKFNYEHFSIGLTIFVIGLFKKVVIADGVSIYATPVFIASEQGIILTFFESWFGSLAYTLQLYFDFSGYSDMAIGVARMFGVLLPLNFYSPYKAKNIIEFWRHWHMTLSRFLRDYIYIPLGGSRKGKIRRYVNLMLTMLLGGLWHGAGWTFVLWGVLHGFYLIINHAWHHLYSLLGGDGEQPSNWYASFLARLITFIAIIVGWVFFRSETYEGAFNILSSMFGLNGFSVSPNMESLNGLGVISLLVDYGLKFDGFFFNELAYWPDGVVIISLALLVALFFPNTQQIMKNYNPAVGCNEEKTNESEGFLLWKPTIVHLIIVASVFIYSILSMSTVSEFLYFNF